MGAWIETPDFEALSTDKKSHSMWVRGLKHCLDLAPFRGIHVAFHVGAWIETYVSSPLASTPCVAFHVGAWIETYVDNRALVPLVVAFHVGAWIETLSWYVGCRYNRVAFHVGAWIETVVVCHII